MEEAEWSIDVHLIQQDANQPYARGRVSAKGGARLIGNGSDAIFGRGVLFWVANRARYLKQRRPKNAGLSKNNFVMAITSCEAESISRCSRGRDGSTPNTTHGFPVAAEAGRLQFRLPPTRRACPHHCNADVRSCLIGGGKRNDHRLGELGRRLSSRHSSPPVSMHARTRPLLVFERLLAGLRIC